MTNCPTPGRIEMINPQHELLGADTRAGARLAGHATFFEFVSREMPEVLKRWDEYRAGERPAT